MELGLNTLAYENMGTFILKRKYFTLMPYDPKPRIRAIENLDFVAEDYDVKNEYNTKFDEVALSKLFKDPHKYIISKIFEYERDYQQGQGLGEKDYYDIQCTRIEINGPRDIDFFCKPIPDTRVYRNYGPTFTWHLIGNLNGSYPSCEVIDSFE